MTVSSSLGLVRHHEYFRGRKSLFPVATILCQQTKLRSAPHRALPGRENVSNSQLAPISKWAASVDQKSADSVALNFGFVRLARTRQLHQPCQHLRDGQREQHGHDGVTQEVCPFQHLINPHHPASGHADG